MSSGAAPVIAKHGEAPKPRHVSQWQGAASTRHVLGLLAPSFRRPPHRGAAVGRRAGAQRSSSCTGHTTGGDGGGEGELEEWFAWCVELGSWSMMTPSRPRRELFLQLLRGGGIGHVRLAVDPSGRWRRRWSRPFSPPEPPHSPRAPPVVDQGAGPKNPWCQAG